MNVSFNRTVNALYGNTDETISSPKPIIKSVIPFIPSLTPLRGIAAVLVLFYHFDMFISPLAPDDNFLMDKLYLMVDLFFVLSGFILLHVYGSWFSKNISGGQFFKYMRA